MKKKKNIFENIMPCKPTLVSQVPKSDDWYFEIKYDGYRIIAKKQNGKTRLYSKNNLDFSKHFLSVCKSLDKLPQDNFVLDGEVVCFDKDGKRISNQTVAGLFMFFLTLCFLIMLTLGFCPLPNAKIFWTKTFYLCQAIF